MSTLQLLTRLVCGVFLLLATPASKGALILNEVMANNVSAYSHSGSYPDWVELYNNEAAPVALAGLSLTDNLSQPLKFIFPASTPALAAGGYLVVFCDTATNAPGIHTGFSFSSVGEEVGLYGNSGTTLLDSLKFGLQPADYSIGRMPNGGSASPWVLTRPTPALANTAQPVGNQINLRINEWMARPSTGDDWIELYNTDPLPVSLGGLVFTDKTSFPLTNRPIRALSFIAPDEYLEFFASNLAKSDPNHLDFKIGSAGETITLYMTNPITLLDRVIFGAQSIDISQGRLPDGSSSIQFLAKPSPGISNFQPITNVVVNEILTHTDPPLEDAVELFNPTPVPVNIGYWWMSNSRNTPKRYQFPPNTIVPAGGYYVVYENAFRNSNPAYPNFTFNSAHGDSCQLYSADSAGNLLGGRGEVKFGGGQNGVSFGRYVTSIGEEFVAMSQRTFGVDAPVVVDQFRQGKGKANAYPAVGPLVIREVMYHPTDVGTNDNILDEYVELYNITGAAVRLYDLATENILPGAPTNSWSLAGVVTYQFPRLMTAQPEAHILIVGFNPDTDTAQAAAFRAKYALPADTLLLGPWKGKLTNSGGTIDLVKPDPVQVPPHPDAGFLPTILVERLQYGDAAPWPTGTDGLGKCLHRVKLEGFANDPVNWVASAPGPGRLGTPRIAGISIGSTGDAVIEFEAVAGASYAVESSPTLRPATWTATGMTSAATPVTQMTSIWIQIPTRTRGLYFRLVTPAP